VPRRIIVALAITLSLVAVATWKSSAQSTFPVRFGDEELLTVEPQAANAPGIESFRIPPFVVKDQAGIIGPVWAYLSSGPVTLFVDSGRNFPAFVKDSNRLVTDTTIGYTSGDCTGTPHLQQPNTADGWWELIGATYAFRGTGDTTQLLRVVQGDPIAAVTLLSRWSNLNDNCIGNGFTDPIVATPIAMDIDFPLSIE
jgi:hypothetical protein